ncbi:hypothetical protein RintRC_3442 [Richelia intracellularis]|nr:hypothetical protein RintRC_3442 [Richelia intracellularis]
MTLAILPAHVLGDGVFSDDADENPRFVSRWGTNAAPG